MARKQSSPRLEFEAAAIYEYPEHLRPWLEALPKLPGVYQFHGESETLPLYIGKSVNIRSRVLSHLRTADEASMLRQARRISWQRTAGELGALLLEARLIKEQQPLFNKRLRRNKQLCSWLLEAGKPQIVYAREVDFSHQQHLYGLFANRRAALQALQTIADEHRLCYGILGLEPLSRGRACFRSALGRCAGACCGKERVEDHNQRLLAQMSKLQLVCWPWAGPVALEERSPDMVQYHIIHNWLWLGAVDSLAQAAELTTLPAGFDHDGYKILCKPLLSGEYPLHPLG
ncbi:excinuclease Cho [Klebsiella aerogenes]|uniref:excinuclease Cho n=1 Tax=Klebsiella aerogenes TaxID=548 RepID=UPI000665DDD8|nr:excinuclease Cho [Klebsiella aerogenes]HBY1513872.1 excinuclease Cho [Klebsiella aerogenes]HBY1542349.1 excinuclease Cho [Klebsiella aerogenes]HBY1603810.1 excinuclease Cho [Klebsiella aerogenes]HBY1641084.1 excinuclease Cho [Klebsiella aerogenes]HCD3924148.1 excinuclease Cho [Klebsiella aerogenes]